MNSEKLCFNNSKSPVHIFNQFNINKLLITFMDFLVANIKNNYRSLHLELNFYDKNDCIKCVFGLRNHNFKDDVKYESLYNIITNLYEACIIKSALLYDKHLDINNMVTLIHKTEDNNGNIQLIKRVNVKEGYWDHECVELILDIDKEFFFGDSHNYNVKTKTRDIMKFVTKIYHKKTLEKKLIISNEKLSLHNYYRASKPKFIDSRLIDNNIDTIGNVKISYGLLDESSVGIGGYIYIYYNNLLIKKLSIKEVWNNVSINKFRYFYMEVDLGSPNIYTYIDIWNEINYFSLLIKKVKTYIKCALPKIPDFCNKHDYYKDKIYNKIKETYNSNILFIDKDFVINANGKSIFDIVYSTTKEKIFVVEIKAGCITKNDLYDRGLKYSDDAFLKGYGMPNIILVGDRISENIEDRGDFINTNGIRGNKYNITIMTISEFLQGIAKAS
jgi:hypothetical protein